MLFRTDDRQKRRLFWSAFLILLALFSIGQYFFFKESSTKEYYRARAARRGSLRKAKEKNKIIHFHQERQGVSRELFLENSDMPFHVPRRKFFLEAFSADLQMRLKSKEVETIELFENPRGWFQEEFYWIIQGTDMRVFPRKIASQTTAAASAVWFYEGKSNKPVEPEKIELIVPRQRIRYFDAAKAEWNLAANVLTSYLVTFCIVDVPGNEPSQWIDPQTVVIEGTAETMTFNFTSISDKETVTSSGLTLKLGSRSSYIEE